MEKKTKGTIILLSIVYLLVGLALIIWPTAARLAICYVIGAVAVIYGGYRLIDYLKNKNVQAGGAISLTISIVCIILGIVLIFRANAVTAIFGVIIGIAVIADSIIRLQAALGAKHLGSDNWKLYMLFAVIMLVIGVVLLFDPFAGANAAMIISGIVMMCDGILGIWMAAKG